MKPHPLDKLEPRDKPPTTVRAIETWVQQAEAKTGISSRRLGWMVASGVVIAALRRHHLPPHCPLPIEPPGPAPNPVRFDAILSLSGRTWRRITLEVSPDEGQVGSKVERFNFPSLAHFGLPSPKTAAGISVANQISQKLHACSAPHTDDHPNYRVRDIVDLLVLKREYFPDGSDLEALANACRDVFSARTSEATETNARTWPPVLTIHSHWEVDYETYAGEVGLGPSLGEAIGELNDWIGYIDRE